MKLHHLFKKLIPKPSALLGFSLDSTSLRLVELTKAGNDYLVRHCSQTPLDSIQIPPNLPLEKGGIHHPEFVDFLKTTLQASNISARQVALALPHSSVLFKTIELDKTLTESDIAIQVSAHAKQYFNYPLSELMMDFEVLDVSKKHPDLREVRWIAARRQAVEGQIQALFSAGLTVSVVEVDSFSLHRVAAYYLKKQGKLSDNVIVIHGYDTHLLVIALMQNLCIYTQTIDYQKKEDEEFIQVFLTAISQSLHLFDQSENNLSLILLSGQGISADLIAKVQNHFLISTQCLDIFSTLGFYSPYSAHEFAITAGLAMRVIS